MATYITQEKDIKVGDVVYMGRSPQGKYGVVIGIKKEKKSYIGFDGKPNSYTKTIFLIDRYDTKKPLITEYQRPTKLEDLIEYQMVSIRKYQDIVKACKIRAAENVKS